MSLLTGPREWAHRGPMSFLPYDSPDTWNPVTPCPQDPPNLGRGLLWLHFPKGGPCYHCKSGFWQGNMDRIWAGNPGAYMQGAPAGWDGTRGQEKQAGGPSSGPGSQGCCFMPSCSTEELWESKNSKVEPGPPGVHKDIFVRVGGRNIFIISLVSWCNTVKYLDTWRWCSLVSRPGPCVYLGGDAHGPVHDAPSGAPRDGAYCSTVCASQWRGRKSNWISRGAEHSSFRIEIIIPVSPHPVLGQEMVSKWGQRLLWLLYICQNVCGWLLTWRERCKRVRVGGYMEKTTKPNAEILGISVSLFCCKWRNVCMHVLKR